MAETFNDKQLHEFAQTFYGYGNYHSDYWFVGMEEGGGDSFQDVATRLDAWCKRGEHELEDMVEYHAAIGVKCFFDKHPKLQSTWSKLIRIVLSIKGQKAKTPQVREYQRQLLGRSNGETCLIELLPLPSPATNKWLYAQHSQLPHLASREAYSQHYLPLRTAHLKQRIHEYKPKGVVFYSFSYRRHWQEIADVPLSLVASNNVYVGHNGESIFIVTKHPVAHGVTNDYFHKVGQIIVNTKERESTV